MMKKRTVKAFVCAALMAMAFSVTACGSPKTLEEYMTSSPEVKKEMEDQIANSSIDGISISYEVKANEFTATFAFEDESLLTDEVRENVSSTSLEAAADSFGALAGQLDDMIEQKGACTFTIKYVDPDGNVLGEKSFKAPEE